ncbi:MAG: acetyltransferase [Deltaproteobacteria bacterium]|nr:acetyltransferase [Deltaproteobacteria bacterium]
MAKRLGLVANVHPTAKVVDSTLGAYVAIGKDCDITQTTIGDYSYCSGDNEIIYSSIGKFVSIASHARINPGQHPTYTRVTQSHVTYRRAAYGFGEDDIDFFKWREENHAAVGHDVWIGYNAVIMGGVTVGNGAVIGSMAVVTKDVLPFEVVVGNPAKRLKFRFPPEIISRIEKSQWWHWSHELLKERLDDFNDVVAFCERHGK